jgi:hypothetical protein
MPLPSFKHLRSKIVVHGRIKEEITERIKNVKISCVAVRNVL